MAVKLIRFDRWGNQLNTLSTVFLAKHSETLNGSDTLEVRCREQVNKGDRIVWCDSLGAWHEQIVAQKGDYHDEGGLYCIATCENSIAETYGDYILDIRPTDKGAGYALGRVLSGDGSERSNSTRWGVGSVTVEGTNSATFYRQTVRESIADITEKWGGELSTTIEVAGTGVTARKVNLTRRGSDRGRRFEYGRNMSSISRTLDTSDVYTAMYGFGKGEETGNGYGRRIDFSGQGAKTWSGTVVKHVKGKMYVESDGALAVWGRPDASGAKQHVYGYYEDTDQEDAAALMDEAAAALEAATEPSLSYEASVQEFARYGYDFSDCVLGDSVTLIDQAEGFEIRAKGRVTKVERDLLDDAALTSLTIGNIIEDAGSMLAQQYADLQSVKRRSSAWDVAAFTTNSYMQQLVDQFNERFEEGGVYKYEGFEIGTVYSSKPLNADALALGQLRPASGTSAPYSAFQLKGGGFRISSSLNSDGSFKWTTMADGAGIIASAITSGKLTVPGSNASTPVFEADLDKKTVVINASNFTLDAKGNIKATNVDLAGKITATSGKIAGYTISGSSMYSGKASLASTDAGVYIGPDGICVGSGGAYVKMTSAGKVTATNADITGKITSSSGTIGGFTLEDGKLYSGKPKLESTAKGVYIGTDGINVGNGDTYTKLTSAGALTATNVDVKGKITATSGSFSGKVTASEGTIGGFTLTSTSMYNGKSSIDANASGVYVGKDGICVGSSTTYTKLTSAGALTAKNADITGKITSSSGTIGGFTLTSSSIYSGKSKLASTDEGIYIGTDGINVGSGNAYTKLTQYGYLTATNAKISGEINATSGSFSGTIKATTGTIGGFSIGTNIISNDAMALGGDGMTLKSGSSNIGNVGANKWTGDTSKKGLVFDLEANAAYMCWARKLSSSSPGYTTVMTYANQDVGEYNAGRLHVSVPVQMYGNLGMNNYKAYGFWIDADSGGCSGGITGTLKGCFPTSISDSGIVEYWAPNLHLEFKNGLLVKMWD